MQDVNSEQSHPLPVDDYESHGADDSIEEDDDLETGNILSHDDEEQDERAAKQFSCKTLDIEGQVNLSSLVLLDILADEAIRTKRDLTENKGDGKDINTTENNESDFDIDDADLWNM